jgi:hypothetical protein
LTRSQAQDEPIERAKQLWWIRPQQRKLPGRIRSKQTRRLQGNNSNWNNKFCYFCKLQGRKKNVEKGLRKTSPAEMPKDEHIGREYISWLKTLKPNPSAPLIKPKTDSRTMTKNTSLTQPELSLIESISQEPQPFPSKIQLFSKELDDFPHSSS